MKSGDGINFYSHSALKNYDEKLILDGGVVKINPALIAISDGLLGNIPAEYIQEITLEKTRELLKCGLIHTLHIDIVFEDYSSLLGKMLPINYRVFNHAFLKRLQRLGDSYGAYLNIHLLTDNPLKHVKEMADIETGAICFQLEIVKDSQRLKEIVETINQMGACASPVIELVGTERTRAASKEDVYEFIYPILNKIGMITFQAEATGARSNNSTGMLYKDYTASYIDYIRRNFSGTIQIQGGISTETIGQAVRLGCEFAVCGTDIFSNKAGLKPSEVAFNMLNEIRDVLIY